MTSFWTREELTEIGNQILLTNLEGTEVTGIYRDANKIADLLHAELTKQGISISNDETTTHLVCMAAALDTLRDFCENGIDLNIRDARQRKNRATWKDIGNALVITPRRAMERYNPSTKESRRAHDRERKRQQREELRNLKQQ